MNTRIFLNTFGKCLMLLYGTLFFTELTLAITTTGYDLTYKPDWIDLVYIAFSLGLSLHSSTKN